MVAVTVSVAVIEELAPAVFIVTANGCTPASVTVYVRFGGGVAAVSEIEIWTVPRYPLATLAKASSAVTTKNPRLPAVTALGPATCSATATSGFTMIGAWLPVMVALTVSVAVMAKV